MHPNNTNNHQQQQKHSPFTSSPFAFAPAAGSQSIENVPAHQHVRHHSTSPDGTSRATAAGSHNEAKMEPQQHHNLLTIMANQDHHYQPQLPHLSEDQSQTHPNKRQRLIIKGKDIHDHDVLCGRGGDMNKRHPGNIRFDQLVDQYRSAYLSAQQKREKRAISESIVAEICSLKPRGRFLGRVPGQVWCRKQKGKNDVDWQEVSFERAREKACQALREGAPARLNKKRRSTGSSAAAQTSSSSITDTLSSSLWNTSSGNNDPIITSSDSSRQDVDSSSSYAASASAVASAAAPSKKRSLAHSNNKDRSNSFAEDVQMANDFLRSPSASNVKAEVGITIASASAGQQEQDLSPWERSLTISFLAIQNSPTLAKNPPSPLLHRAAAGTAAAAVALGDMSTITRDNQSRQKQPTLMMTIRAEEERLLQDVPEFSPSVFSSSADDESPSSRNVLAISEEEGGGVTEGQLPSLNDIAPMHPPPQPQQQNIASPNFDSIQNNSSDHSNNGKDDITVSSQCRELYMPDW